MIIDPENPYYFEASNEKLEAFLIFGIMVAGKPADRTSFLVDNLVGSYQESPFYLLKKLINSQRLEQRLRDLRTGKYTLLQKSFQYLTTHHTDSNLRDLDCHQLRQIPGVGLKTSRYFKLYTDISFEGMVLDTHLLQYLKDNGYNVPRSTPSSEKRYKNIEQDLIKLFKQSKFDLAYEFDLAIWKKYSNSN